MMYLKCFGSKKIVTKLVLRFFQKRKIPREDRRREFAKNNMKLNEHKNKFFLLRKLIEHRETGMNKRARIEKISIETREI
jgi:hypothetical protein